MSSGGTAKAIADAGLPVTDTAELTGFPAILGHRVVTLHPKVHGGILADPTDPAHRADMEAHGIEAFDLVVVNAYPFGSDPADFEHGGNAGAMDVLDIGGPAMIRAAAKNHAHVGVVIDPADYDEVLDELRDARPRCPTDLRRRLARKAFAFTAAYDAGIVAWFDAADGIDRPESLHLTFTREPVELRYGENPHQAAALYRAAGADPWWAHVEVHGGIALSYLNLFDADAAWLLAHDLDAATGQPAVAIIKHANPCGAAVADDLADAYQLAFECDPRSAFGGIVALSRAGRRGHRRGDGRGRPGRRRRSPPATPTAPSTPSWRSGRTPGCSRRRRRRPTRATSARSPAGCWCRIRTGSSPAGPTGGSSPSGSRPRPSGPTPSWRGASAAT